MEPEPFDAIIIGTGQAGKPLALALARAGWKTAVIERRHVGGTCINVGCTPTKTMVASARVAWLARRAADYGVIVPEVTVDQVRVRARKRALVERFRDSGTDTLQKTGNLTLLFGVASFRDASVVEVRLQDGETRLLTAPKIVINTGGQPFVPPITGLSEVPFLDSTSVMELESTPSHLIVLGGGYVGLEFAQMFRRFGAQVTVIERDRRLIAREDPDISSAVQEILVQEGLRIETGTDVERVAAAAAGGIRVDVVHDGAARSIVGSHLLVAIGRRPSTQELELEAAGIAVDKAGYISVDETLQTSVPGVWAVGDVKGGPAFTHIAYDDHRILRDRWLHGRDARVTGRMVPNTTFIDPQLGRIGLSESEAERQGRKVRVAKIPMSGFARALETDEPRGLIKVVIDAGTDHILGCAVLGIEGGEIMSMIQIAMMGDLPYTALKEAIFAHPTLAEGLNNVFLALDA